MRIVTATRARTPRWRPVDPARGRAPRIEAAGLAVTSLVLLLGLWLTYAEQTAGFAAAEAELQSGRLIDLNALRQEQALLPHLTMVDDEREKASVAAAIYQRARATGGGRLEHVGALAPLFRSADLAQLKRTVVVRTPDQFRRRIIAAVALFMLAFWSAHVARWYFGTTGDPLLLPVVQLLCGLGVVAMLALRDPLRDMILAGTVAGGIAAGCVLWVALGFVDFENARLRRAVLAPLTAALLLAVALLLFGSGPTGSGARVNLLGMQPVELGRLLVVFALAGYFARRWQFLRELSADVGGTPRVRRLIQLPRWKDVRPLGVSIAALLALFFLQRDLGPALVLSCIFLGLYGIARARAGLVVAGAVVLAIGFAAGYALGTPPTVTRRVAIALDPWENGLPGGDQISHAIWALASGGLWGLGPGVGDPQVIPAGHTDLVIAALGEELGYIGFAVVAALFALLVWRLLRLSVRAPGDYTAFLVIGLTLALAVQAIVIVAGMLGLLPLAGVVTPFLSYGRSAMLSNFAAIAVCAAIARRRGRAREAFAAPARALGATLAVATAIMAARAADVQVVRADEFATRANLTQQADGGYRYQYNPRLTGAARAIVRGTIFDRTGLPIATSRPEEVARSAARYKALGLDLPEACLEAGPATPLAAGERCYPLGGPGFHLLGDAARQTNWAARNTSYIEQDFDARLKGYDDRPETIEVTNPRTGVRHTVIRRDYSELLPLLRHKANPSHEDVRRILDRDRSLHVTIDAGLQLQAARALREHAARAGAQHGAAAVLDPATGDLLAAASYPWPDAAALAGERAIDPPALLDRARYGLYPPGSTFKLVTAVAALRTETAVDDARFQCVHLPDGRVGGRVRGLTRPVRDDLLDRTPHGRVDLHRGLVVSCNPFFANLAAVIGPQVLSDVAAEAQIAAAPAPAAANLKHTLPFAGYGQGDVLASPLRMAGVAGALASGGVLREVRVTQARARAARTQWVTAPGAERIRAAMRDAVLRGTGRVLARHPVAIAGKTGTAELDGRRSHSWFVGFAPFSGARRIAFAVVVEQAGYGARVAAPAAGDIVSAARTLGVLQ